ncbi:MFS transporter [Acinetobacter wuhouensis]|uniref:MFS transporter n=1 Tax=Acinetobacter wuhouensis TaxID=1879050 RepID=UPI00083B9CA1|nr:MFS transporter [Acinetobacter wuhouensis]AXQ22411.1 MFS transporter [Acinetobacter wuhouensis]
MNKNNDKTLWILLSASLANGVSFSMILPLLAPLIRQLHMTEFQAGLLVSVSALLMSLTAMWISKKAQWQNQFYLLSIGFIGMTITWGLFSAVLSYGVTYSIAMSLLFSLLLVTRASTGIFMAMPQIALQSFVMTSCTEEKQRSQMMAKFGSLNSVGLILGPLVTTLLIGWGILVPMWLAVIILALMSIVIVCLYPKEQLNHQAKIHQKQETYLQQEGDVVANLKQIKLQQDSINKAIIWLILGFSLYIAIVTLNLTAGFYIQDKFQLSIPQSAIYFSQCSLIVGIALVMMQIAISKWLKWSLQQLLFVGLSSMLLGLGISIISANIFIFQSAYIFYGIAVACLMPAFTTGAAQSVALNLQTKIAALCTMVQGLSLVVAPLLSTALYQFDMIFPYYMLIGIFILFSGYFVVLRLKTEKYG